MSGPDVLLVDALIVDGTGEPPFHGDVAISGDTITSVLPSDVPRPERGSRAIDCSGQVLLPGFIDIHTHSDLSFLVDPLASSKVIQGVTTDVVGNCGFSAFPAHQGRQKALEEFLRGLGMPPVEVPWSDLDGYVEAMESSRLLMNLAPLVGHGSLRIAAAGTGDVPITEALLADLTRRLEESLEQGAFGLSTGLTYVPSTFGTVEEIHTLASVVERFGGVYATHARVTPTPFGLFDEAIEVGRRTGVRVQFSHVALNDPNMWGRAGDVLDRFQAAVESGVDIRYDVYPYDASASSLTQYLPDWAQEDGEAGLRDLLKDSRQVERAEKELARGLFGTIPWDWSRVVVSLAGPGDEDTHGKSIAVSALERGVSPERLCLELCGRHGNNVQVVLFYRQEQDVREFLAHPLSIVGSDGSAMPIGAPGRPHPRSFGAHARLLQRYVGERHLTLSDAIHKATLAPAQQLGLNDRGMIAAGARADLVVLDLDQVRETATWTDPCSLAQGVVHVWINGMQVVSRGQLTGARPGRVLRAR